MASNSLLFTAQARRQTAPPPEPIGKRSTVRDRSSPSASELLMTRKASKEWSPYYEYDIAGVKRPRSRPPSIRSSHKSSLCSGKSRSTVQRKQSIETVRSKVSVTSGVSASRLNGRFIRLTLDEPASLTNIPTELVHAICRYLPRDDLCNFICVCKRIHTDVTVLLYATPQFVSTYRLAQFVTIISHNQRLAELVRELNLSGISKLPTDFGLAGWREWKYRSEKLYSVYPEGNTVGLNFKHPLAHPLLLKHSTGGPDVPLGLLMHIVKACTHLRVINLNDLHIAADYVILPSAALPRWKPLLPSLHKPPTYHPTSFTNLLFISDVPKSNTWHSAEFRTLKYEEFIDALCSLEELEVLSLRRAVWLKRVFAEEIVLRAGGEFGLRNVNFTGCGMNPGLASWTKKWTGRKNDSVRSLFIFD